MGIYDCCYEQVLSNSTPSVEDRYHFVKEGAVVSTLPHHTGCAVLDLLKAQAFLTLGRWS